MNNSCLNNCSNNGRCDKGSCSCIDGWYGIDCSCEQHCKNGGICTNGKCLCPKG